MGKIGFCIFDHFIAYYGFMVVIGLFVASLIAYRQIRKYNLNGNDFILITSISALGIVIAAKILYLVISIPVIDFKRLDEFSYFNSLMSGGFIFYGGVIGGILSLYFCKKILKIDIVLYLQYCTACIPIAHGFGRIGCFLVGCCYGIPYDGLFSVIYRYSAYAPNNISVFPVQLVEAFGDFLIGIVLLSVITSKWGGISKFLFYISAYTVMRFIIEFFRGDVNRGYIGVLSVSQYMSIILFSICFTIFTLNYKKEK